MGVISNTSENWVLTPKNFVSASASYVFQPSDTTKNVAQSMNYEIKQKKANLKGTPKIKILRFERDIEKCCLSDINYSTQVLLFF